MRTDRCAHGGDHGYTEACHFGIEKDNVECEVCGTLWIRADRVAAEFASGTHWGAVKSKAGFAVYDVNRCLIAETTKPAFARLIAAIPDMVEALDRLTASALAGCTLNGKDLEFAVDALKKARGR